LFYPLLIRFAARKKQLNYQLIPTAALPAVSIVMAAHNEEKVLEQKIRSVFNGNYPQELIEFYIGSDNSSDSTNEILITLSKEFPQLKITLFTERQGKINIFNKLVPQASNEIIISTDANNMFFENTIHELVSALCSDENVGLVDTLILHNNLKNDGMSLQEHTYISTEANKKHYESILFGIAAGPFGGCYIFRKKL
jgi:cellulose synthase/poly-beta-1,6-N-acetylglucosamine synthase-like glycosyltransferase